MNEKTLKRDLANDFLQTSLVCSKCWHTSQHQNAMHMTSTLSSSHPALERECPNTPKSKHCAVHGFRCKDENKEVNKTTTYKLLQTLVNFFYPDINVQRSFPQLLNLRHCGHSDKVFTTLGDQSPRLTQSSRMRKIFGTYPP